MRVELRGYQDVAVGELLRCLEEAIRGVRRYNQTRAVAFAAPTGAGKTVMMAAVVEQMMVGGDIAARAGIESDPELTFLWLSDRPDLNQQSRARIVADANGLSGDRFVTIENDFDRETLAPGTVYFLNFQKLRSGSLLSRLGDSRTSTIWEIIAATQAARPGKLIVVIDEAHRGLSTREQNEAQTIASYFVRGSQGDILVRGAPGTPAAPFPPIQIVVGVSATPERFTNYLQAEGGRIKVEVVVAPAQVRGSGLIKDRIILVGPEDLDRGQVDAQWTLLSHACAKIQDVDAAWRAYSAANSGVPNVVPALVIQVADGNAGNPTTTSLEALVHRLREDWAELSPQSIVHCFHGVGPLEPVPGWVIPYRDPNELAADTSVRVILFKTALNTGWDCPRAEVMMSFRTLADRTAIAQLVGRMVRTPLAARVPGDDVLNSTYLYLPFFDQENLEAVKTYLTTDAHEVAAEVVSASETQLLTLRPGGEHIFDMLKLLPTDVVAAERPIPDVKRLLKLCRLLEAHQLDLRATRGAVDGMMEILEAAYSQRAAEPDFEAWLARRGSVTIAQLTVADGQVASEDVTEADLGSEDINRAFRAASSVLADEVGLAWVRAHYDENDPLRAKLIFLELVRSAPLLAEISEWAKGHFFALLSAHETEIQALGEGRRDQYVALQRSGRSVQRGMMAVESRVMFPLPDDATNQRGHLYVQPGSDDVCRLALNGWERAVLAEERDRPDFVAFLRNLDRKRWALSFAYDYFGTKPGYPDFLIFRQSDGGIVTDILEPHQGEDTLAKAKGLADFAARCGNWFGRIEMIRLDQGVLRRLALHEPDVRAAVAAAADMEALLALF
jgi:type III restriction enzyme